MTFVVGICGAEKRHETVGVYSQASGERDPVNDLVSVNDQHMWRE